MKERLITYGPTMVRAKRAGLKTMTRRVVKGTALEWLASGFTPEYVAAPENHLCPYGVTGDILLTREAWCASSAHDDLPPSKIPVGDAIAYLADGEPRILAGRYRHARFMCRWMCRDRDEITAVRIERLQDISEADAMAEGVEAPATPEPYRDACRELVLPHKRTATDAYRALWEQINGPGSWDANAWVWVLTFRRVP